MIAALLLALAADPVSVGIETDRMEYYLGERIPVRVRVEIDGKFLRENAVPLTLRRTDVPVLLEAPWLKGLPAGEGDATLAVNDEVVPARRSGDGTTTVLVIERTLRPEKAGDLELAAPVLRFAGATRFNEDALGTRVALDRTEFSAKGAPLTIRILPLPAEGRPPGFSGGVGQFTITASVDSMDVEPGKSLHLALVVEGSGDLSAIAPPRLAGLGGFHVYGRLDGGDASKRTFTYEIAPTHGKSAGISAIPLYYFDPAPPAGYRVVWTEGIALRMAGNGESAPPPSDGSARGPSAWLLALAVVVAIATALLVRGRRGGSKAD